MIVKLILPTMQCYNMLLMVLALAALQTVQAAAPGKPYQANLVMYSPFSNPERPEENSPLEILEANLDDYSIYANQFPLSDIVVFPEYGLTTPLAGVDRTFAKSVGQIVPSTADFVNPCDQDKQEFEHLAVRRLSCIAKQNRAYLIANLIEIENCTFKCRPDEVNVFSTNVAFDREGVLVASYRKTHLLGEPALDKSAVLFVSSFHTDMDITYGIMTSADLLFSEPTLSFLGGFYVYDYLVPMALKGQLPFLTPLQIQAGWFESHKNEREIDLSLVAAQLVNPENGYSGNGVYHQLRADHQEVESADRSEAWRAQVNEVNAKSTGHGTVNSRDLQFDKEDFAGYTAIDLSPNVNELTTVEGCNRLFCCSLTYKVLEHSSVFNYKFLVYNGDKNNPIGNDQWNVQVCALVACSGSSFSSCADPVQDSSIYTKSTYFETLDILGTNFTSTFNTIPTTLLENSYTLNGLNYTKPPFGLPGDIAISYNANSSGIGGIHTYGLYSAIEL